MIIYFPVGYINGVLIVLTPGHTEYNIVTVSSENVQYYNM